MSNWEYLEYVGDEPAGITDRSWQFAYQPRPLVRLKDLTPWLDRILELEESVATKLRERGVAPLSGVTVYLGRSKWPTDLVKFSFPRGVRWQYRQNNQQVLGWANQQPTGELEMGLLYKPRIHGRPNPLQWSRQCFDHVFCHEYAHNLFSVLSQQNMAAPENVKRAAVPRAIEEALAELFVLTLYSQDIAEQIFEIGPMFKLFDVLLPDLPPPSYSELFREDDPEYEGDAFLDGPRCTRGDWIAHFLISHINFYHRAMLIDVAQAVGEQPGMSLLECLKQVVEGSPTHNPEQLVFRELYEQWAKTCESEAARPSLELLSVGE